MYRTSQKNFPTHYVVVVSSYIALGLADAQLAFHAMLNC